MACTEDVDDFIERVDEVSRLINGLSAGTIPVDYVDRKIEQRRREQDAPAADAKARGALPPGSQPKAGPGSDADQGKDAEVAAKEEEARQADLMRKVKELKANRARKLKARAKYEEYMQQQQQRRVGRQPQQAGGGAASGGGDGATDYARWDMWCPSDEEDDLFGSLTPNNAGFRMMERDINERHKRMVEQRQLAERQRVAGNAAMASGQWSEALRCYEVGLEHQRHSAALHANAALAALKVQCYVQALEHCDRVLYLCGSLHGRRNDPLCTKALQRRAAAHQALGQHGLAVTDLERALGTLGGGDKEVAAQLARARALREEAAKQKHVDKALKGGKGGSSADVTASEQLLDIQKLREVEVLSCQLSAAAAHKAQALEQQKQPLGERQQEQAAQRAEQQGRGTKEQVGVSQACDKLAAIVISDDACSTHFRTCGGFKTAAGLLVSRAATALPALPAKSSGGSGPPDARKPAEAAAQQQGALLVLLEAACANRVTLDQAAADDKLPAAAAKLLGSGNGGVRSAAARLLLAASSVDGGRQIVCKALGAQKGAGFVRLLAMLKGAATSMQLVVLSLAGTCMAQKGSADAFAELLAQPFCSTHLGAITALISAGGAGGTGAVVAERALALLCSGCAHSQLRQELAGSPRVAAAVIDVALGSTGGEELQAAALACLLNLAIEPGVRRILVGRSQQLEALLQLACGGGGGGASSGVGREAGPGLLSSRAAGLVARLAKDPEGGAALEAAGALRQLVDAIASHQRRRWQQEPPQSPQQQQQPDAGGRAAAALLSGGGDSPTAELGDAWLEGAVRAAALLAGRPGFCGASGCGAELGPATIGAMAAVCGCGRAGESATGNAALCLGYFAAAAEGGLNPWAPQLLRADAVAALLAAARRAGRGSAAARNAGIALAKACRADARLLERLRELRGLEVIYEYVRP